MLGFYYKIVTRKFNIQNTNTVFRVILTLVFLFNMMGEFSIVKLIISTLAAIAIIWLLVFKYKSNNQKKFNAILQMLGSDKKQSILHQFLNSSSASLLSLTIFLVLSDFLRLLSANFNFLDTSSILSLDNLTLAFSVILGLNLATSIVVNFLKKDSDFFQILRE